MKTGKKSIACILLLNLVIGVFMIPAATPAADASASTLPRVGCYYFPGWTTAEMWSDIKHFSEGPITPVAGYYRNVTPEVHELHIKQALQHGISFWIYDLYYDITKDAVYNPCLDNGFLKAPSCKDMDFAVMWCNEEADFSGYSREQLLQMVDTFGEKYFSQPNYLKTGDGRCVFAMTRPDRLLATHGEDGTRALLEEMNAAASKWGGLFYLTIKNPVEQDMTQMQNSGFDAITLYSYGTGGLDVMPYDSITPTFAPLWESALESGIINIIPTVSPNWDSRPWAGLGGRGSYFTGSTPELFGNMCESFKNYIDPALNMIMVGTWNEFGEGSYVEPTNEFGCDYLDAMQKALFPNSFKDHSVLMPGASELAAMIYEDIPPKQGNLSPTENQLTNPGFEFDYGWVTFDESRIEYSSDIKNEGSRSMALTKEQRGVKSLNQIEVRPGMEYEISVWVYGYARLVSALFNDVTWLGTYAEHIEGGQMGEWTKLEVVYTPDDPNVKQFDLEVFNNEESGSIYIDNAAVFIVGNIAEDNIVADPGFEEEGKWIDFYDRFTVSAAGEPVRGSTRSFKMSKESIGMKSTEKINYVPGAEYDASYWTYGKSMMRLGLYAPDGTLVDYLNTELEGGTQGEWTEIVGTLALEDRSDISDFDVQILNMEEDYENMVANPDMEGEEIMFYAFGGDLNWDSGIAHSGVRSFQVSLDNAGSKYDPPLDVEYGQTYCISGWVYGKANILAAQFDSEENVIDYYTSIASGGVEGEWTFLSGVFKIENPNIKQVNIEFRPAGKPINVDDVKMTIANDVFIDGISLSAFKAKPPQAPQALTVAPGSNECVITWMTPADNGSQITHYLLSYKTSESNVGPISIGSGETSFTLTGLKEDTAHNLTLIAVNEIGESEGAYAIFFTLPADSNEDGEAEDNPSMTWLYFVIGGVVILTAGAIFIIVLLKKRSSDADPK